MNSVGIVALWSALQVTFFVIAACGVYLIARRRGAAAGSAAAVGALFTLIAVSVLALSPWPRWWHLDAASFARTTSTEWVAESQTDVDAQAAVDLSQIAAASPEIKKPTAEIAAAQLSEADRNSVRQAFLASFVESLRETPAQQLDPAWRWPAWLAIVIVAGVVLALVRVAVGLSAVHWYRRKTKPVDDLQLRDLIDMTRARLGCTKTVEPRESVYVSSPATIGWLRPLLLLPPHWRTWNEKERQVVVAHEVAHICRGDYAAWLLAQMSLALHFYHPLVHWLVARLRVEQEVAADHLGASAVGGRATYLTTLAQMALREDDRAVRWAARPFLPSRDTFLRRIAMLRDTRQRPSTPLGWSGRSLVLAALVGAGILVAGIRGPITEAADGSGPDQLAQRSNRRTEATDNGETVATGAKQKFSLQYVPSDAVLVAAIRPAELLNIKGLGPVRDFLNRENPFAKELGFPVDALEEVTLVVSDLQGPPPGRIIFRANRKVDWSQLADENAPNAVEVNIAGKTYFKPRMAEPNNAVRAFKSFCYHQADYRTFILANEREMRELLANGQPETKWADAWKEMANGQIAVMQDVSAALAALPPQALEQPLFTPFMPLLEQTRFAVFAAGAEGETVVLKVRAECRSEDAAQRVADTAKAAMTLAANSIPTARRQIGNAPPEARTILLDLLDMGEEILKQQDAIEVKGRTVQWRAEGEGALAAPVLAAVLPAVQKARHAARRAQSANNLKQIALAMHNFQDTHQHFPAAAVIGPDGKTPHSWRVAILPFIEQADLHKQYKFDEPWDSEHNLKLLEKIPPIYRAPGDDKSTNSAYYVLTGKETMFFDKKGTSFAHITDGTSNTIMTVEAKRNIPWTKPEDIPFDSSKPLPEFGGFFEDGFNAGLADGSVRFLMQNIDPQVLKALITRGAGENVSPF